MYIMYTAFIYQFSIRNLAFTVPMQEKVTKDEL